MNHALIIWRPVYYMRNMFHLFILQRYLMMFNNKSYLHVLTVSMKNMVSSENIQEYEIVDGTNNVCNAIFNSTKGTFVCSCKLFVRFGLLCSHVFSSLRILIYVIYVINILCNIGRRKPFLKPIYDVDCSEVESYVVVDESTKL